MYGRILDDQGSEVTGAKVAAATTEGSALASTSSKSQGMFELRVPLQAPKKAAKEKKKDQAEEASVSFQIVVTAKTIERPCVSPEILTAVSKRLAYREIACPSLRRRQGEITPEGNHLDRGTGRSRQTMQGFATRHPAK